MQNLSGVAPLCLRNEQSHLRDIAISLQHARCVVAILIAALNKHVYRHEQGHLEILCPKLEAANRLLSKSKLCFITERSTGVDDKIRLLEESNKLLARLRELEDLIVKRWPLCEKISEAHELTDQCLNYLQNLARAQPS